MVGDRGSSAGNGSLEAGTSGDAAGDGGHHSNGGRVVRSLVLKAVCLLGGAFLIRRLTKTTTRWDHTRIVAQALSGEKVFLIAAPQSPQPSSLWPFRAFSLILGF